jgi:PAS domain S-box-containing protein
MIRIPAISVEEINIQQTLDLILKSAVKALGGIAGVVAAWSDVDNCFRCSAAYGINNKTKINIHSLLSEVSTDTANCSESFALLAKIRYNLVTEKSDRGEEFQPIIALPLKIGEKSIGLIYVLRSRTAPEFSSVDKPVLQAFAEQAAIALQNASMVHMLAEEKRRVESILENSADGIMSIDSDCHIIGFNAAMEKITGYSREEVLGRTCDSVLKISGYDGKNLCSKHCPMKQEEAAGPVFERKGLIVSKNGKRVFVSMIYSIVRSTENKPVNAVVNVHDISKSVEMENFRETLLSMLGHELQTPLAIIKGYTGTLSRPEGKWDQETIKQGLQAIEDESDRLSRVMDEILLASRISGGALKIEKEPVQLPFLVRKVVRRQKKYTEIHTFEVVFPDKFPTIKASPRLIEQVLSNLIENAVKYSPEGGRVTVSGINIDDSVKITVTDEGIGITADDMDHLFEKFHRGETGILKKIEGTGLGLYICKSIIEAHGGRIEFASDQGKGSQFSFTFPLDKESD